MAKKKWSELSSTQQKAIIVGGAIEVVLTTAAYIDLIARDPALVRGSKPLWALGLVIQPVGPLAYFAFGRKPAISA